MTEKMRGEIPSESKEKEQVPLPEQQMFHREFVSVIREDQSFVEGPVYDIDGTNYLLAEEDGKQKIFAIGEKVVEVDDPEIAKSIVEIERRNHEISKARENLAQEIAKDDPNLKDILVWNVDYNKGRVSEPIRKEGIKFYKVGHNATHQFYAGVEGDKKYVYTIGEGGWDDEKDMPIIEENVREVEDWGYMGHL